MSSSVVTSSATPTTAAGGAAGVTTAVAPSSASIAAAQSQAALKPIEPEKIYAWINELCMQSTRENALLELRQAYYPNNPLGGEGLFRRLKLMNLFISI